MDIESQTPNPLSTPPPPRLVLSTSEPLCIHSSGSPTNTDVNKSVCESPHDTPHKPTRERTVSAPTPTFRYPSPSRDLLSSWLTPLPLLRRISSNRKTPIREVCVFYCLICLQNHALEDGMGASSCTNGSVFCRAGIEMHMNIAINDGVTDIHCPCGMCAAVFTDAEVSGVVDEEMYAKMVRFRDIKQNPNLRECPKCNHSQTGDKNKPAMVCSKCGEQYCFFHSNAHPNMSCGDYSRAQLRADMKSVATIKSTARKCPKCYAYTEKNGGCNHMTCQHCGENWCWLCGRHLTDNHYEDPINGCIGGQFVEPPAFALWTIIPCLRHPGWEYIFRLPLYMFMLLALVIGMGAGLIGFAVCVSFFPLTLAAAAVDYFYHDSFEDTMFILGAPGLLTCFILAGIVACVVEIAWLPFGFVLFIGNWLSHLANQDEGRCGLSFMDEEAIASTWFYPLTLVMNVLFREDD